MVEEPRNRSGHFLKFLTDSASLNTDTRKRCSLGTNACTFERDSFLSEITWFCILLWLSYQNWTPCNASLPHLNENIFSLKDKCKTMGDCVFKFLWRSVNQKRLIRSHSENTSVVWEGSKIAKFSGLAQITWHLTEIHEYKTLSFQESVEDFVTRLF